MHAQSTTAWATVAGTVTVVGMVTAVGTASAGGTDTHPASTAADAQRLAKPTEGARLARR